MAKPEDPDHDPAESELAPLTAGGWRPGSLGLWVQWAIVIGALIIASLIVWERLVGLEAARLSIQAQNRTLMLAASDRIADYLGDVYADLLVISLDPAIQAMKGAPPEHIKALFQHKRNRWRLSELYVVERNFDGSRRPVMTFENSHEGNPEERAHSLEREADEYRIQIEQIARFEREPVLDAQISPIISLCLPDDQGQRKRGFVYSAPIKKNDEFLGILAAMVPSDNISTRLKLGSYGTMTLLVPEHGDAIGCIDFPEELRRWFEETIGSGGIADLVSDENKAFQVNKWTGMSVPVRAVSDQHLRLFYFYDESASLKDQPSLAQTLGFAAAVILAGFAMALLARASQSSFDKRLKSLRDRRRSHQMLESIVEGTSSAIGDEFFRSMVRHIADAFDIQYVLVGELNEDDENRITTLAVWANGAIAANFEYDLTGTPCENAIDKQACIYPTGVQKLFPRDVLLQEMGIDSYLGTPLVGAGEKPVGILALLGTESLKKPDAPLKSMLTIFASRAAAEIERRRSDEARRRTEELNTSIIETMSEGIVVLDSEFRIISWNRSMEKITGYRKEEVVAGLKRPWDIFPHLRKQEAQDQIRQAMAGEVTRRDRVPFQLTTGEEGLLTEVHHPLVTPKGEIRGIVCVIRDVTHESELEERLRQAQKLEAVGTLAGGIAHDFNNILQVVLGFAEMALSELPEESNVRSAIEEITAAGKRGARLASQVLAFSRRSEHESTPLNLLPLIKETMVLLRSSLPSTIEIRQYLDPQCGSVLADPAQIQQLVMNLVTNAFQAMRDGGGELKINLEEVDINNMNMSSDPANDLPPGRYARLSIADTGKGIDEITAARVFEPYFSTRTRGEGTGLGLATVHGIATSCGGTVWVESESGKGATFRVLLPIHEPLNAPHPDDSGPKPVMTRGTRVMFIDDEEPLVRLGEAMLKHLGYEVVGKTDSAAALAAFKDAPQTYDLIVTDLTMPKMNGLDLAAELLRIRPEIPIVLSTGSGDNVDHISLQAAGITEVLLKPASLGDLERATRHALTQALKAGQNDS